MDDLHLSLPDWDGSVWQGPVPLDLPNPQDPPDGPVPIPVRIAHLRAFVRSQPSPDAAAAALGISLGTLRRNLNRNTATHGALDIIWEGLDPLP